MEKKFKKLRPLKALSFGLLFYLMASCHNNPSDLSVSDAKNAVSLAEVSLAATRINTIKTVQSSGRVPGGTTALTSASIASIDPIPDSKSPSFYIINYVNNQGWLILSADKRVEPVQAFSGTGSFQKSGIVGEGVGVWLSNTHKKIAAIKNDASSTPKKTIQILWDELLTDQVKLQSNGNATDKIQPTPPPGDGGPPGCVDSDTHTGRAALLLSTWGQGCGYNSFDPEGTYDCYRVPTGCVPTAMGQLMYYWRAPASRYNFSLMANTFGSDETSRLIYDAGNGIVDSYSSSGTDVSCGSCIATQLHNFGYTSASYNGYSFPAIRSELDARRPVYLDGSPSQSCFLGYCWGSGVGHAWVCDGYSFDIVFSCESLETDEFGYLDMNWGWDGRQDGMFNEENWTVVVPGQTTGTNFRYFSDMITNIHP